ncbi:MAG: DJ-1/PfpI family protein [Pseudobdellovibrio sp.]
MKKVAIIAAGFGIKQTELTETISLLVSLSELNASFKIFALDLTTPLNHHEIYPLASLNADEFDALVIPGGAGIGCLLSNWSEDQKSTQVHPTVEKLILKFYDDSKPIGAICAGPLLVARVLREHSPCITLGENYSKAEFVKKWGAILETCPSTDFITDRNTKVITTPAYMNDDVTPFQVFSGIRAMTKELVEMA